MSANETDSLTLVNIVFEVAVEQSSEFERVHSGKQIKVLVLILVRSFSDSDLCDKLLTRAKAMQFLRL
jgi:hypothetical protein